MIKGIDELLDVGISSAGKRCYNQSGGWVCRVTGDGSDKSDLHIVRVREEPGYTGDMLHTFGKGRAFKREKMMVFDKRSEARDAKKAIGWSSNHNSWSKQSRDGYDY